MRHILLLTIVVLLLAPAAWAENDCTFTNPYTNWAAVGDNVGACTETADDNFVVTSGKEVYVSGTVTLTTGSITVITGGTLIVGPGAILKPGAALRIQGGTFIAQGTILDEDRVQATSYTKGPPDLVTLTGAKDQTGAVTTSDFVVFGDDDPSDMDVPIKVPPLIGPTNPAGGTYRWSAAKWTWWPVQAITAGSAHTIALYSDPYKDLEALGGACTAYSTVDTDCFYTGTFGPALDTSTAITSNTRQQHGLYSKINIDLLVDPPAAERVESIDGDLSDQYVEFTSGACSGKMARIAWMENNASPTADDIYVWGDTSACGQTPTIRINYGMRVGDKIRYVRPAIIDGADTAQVEWSGGKVQIDLARFTHLDDGASSVTVTTSLAHAGGTEDWGNACNFCIFRDSAGNLPTFSGSYITRTEFAYGNTNAEDTPAIGGMNGNPTSTGYLNAQTVIDATGLILREIYVHDQHDAVNAGDIHGIWMNGFTGVAIEKFRVARVGDDGIVSNPDGYGDGLAQTIRVRHAIVDGYLSVPANTQQNIELAPASTRDDINIGSIYLSDAFLGGSDNGTLAVGGLGQTIKRIALQGGGGVAGEASTSVGFAASVSSTTANAIYSSPNKWSNLMDYEGGLASINSGQPAKLSGSLDTSVLFGAERMTALNMNLTDATAISHSFVDLGAGTQTYMMNRSSSSSAVYATPTLPITDSVILKGTAGRTLCNNMSSVTGTGNVPTNFNLLRVRLGVQSYAGGFLTGCYALTDGSQTFTADGLVLTSNAAAGGGGLACGAANGGGTCTGTNQGASITHACVEALDANGSVSINSFGASVTATSHNLGVIEPDQGDDAPLRAYTQPSNAVSICAGSMPQNVGLSEFGTEMSLTGDFVLDQVDRWTTNTKLLNTFSGGAGGGGPNIQ